jgi:hypothetical protein
MVRTRFPLIAIVVLASTFFPQTSNAQIGHQGYDLLIPPTVEIGGSLVIHLRTSHHSQALLMCSLQLSDTPVPTPFGLMALTMPPLAVFSVSLPPPTEAAMVRCPIPCDRSLVGTFCHFQFGAVLVNSGQTGVSNLRTVRVTDSDCDG